MNTEQNTPAPQVGMVSELPNVREQFTEWLAREMPAGTVIGNPRWWAPKIIRAFHDYRTIAREKDKLTSPGSMELPDLPDSYGDHCVTDSVRTMREPGYTADQMRAYAQAALNARAGGDAVVFRFRDTEIGENWSRWLDIADLCHYQNGDLVSGPHPDWEIQYAYAALASQAVGVKDGR